MRAAGFTPINRNRPLLRKARTELAAVLSRFLAQQARPLIHQLFQYAIPTGASAHILAGVDHLRFDWDALRREIQPILARIAQDGVAQATKQITRYRKGMRKADEGQAPRVLTADQRKLVTLPNPRAEDWAEDRAAELVGMKVFRGPDKNILHIDENPDARWSITESTREKIREQVRAAIERGDSNDELARAIEDGYAFTPERAELIARTETASADVQGNLIGYKELGVEKKESIKSDLHDIPDECDDNADAGPIPLEDDFPSGDDGPPYHPGCFCDVLPVLEDESDDVSVPESANVLDEAAAE